MDEYEAAVKDRQHNLTNLNSLVSRLIKKGCVSIETQTEEFSLES